MHLEGNKTHIIKLIAAAALTLALCALLSACTAVPLAERKIIRAIYFETDKKGPGVVLLVQKHDDAERGTDKYEAISGTGQNYREAWQAAEDALEGKPFYGLLDIAVLPQDCSRSTARLLGNLITEIAAPIPEISLFMQGPQKGKSREDAYQSMVDAEKMYQFHWGLETLMADEDEAILPFMAEDGYGCLHICKDASALKTTTALASQLFAILNGHAKVVQCRFMDETQAVRADAAVYHRRIQGTVQVELTLKNVEWRTLKGNKLSQNEQQTTFVTELQKLYAAMQTQNNKRNADPFHLGLFMASYGKLVDVPPLEVLFVQ